MNSLDKSYCVDDYFFLDLRQELILAYKKLIDLHLNRGTSGNCSVRIRTGKGLLITPSGLPVEKLTPDTIVQMDLEGVVNGEGIPSSEWQFHCDIMKHRPEVSAIVHTHSISATAIACLRMDIPAFHYMVAVAGGNSIRCAPYELFGTHELSVVILRALRNRQACLLANHGVVVLGGSLYEAVQLAQEIETLAEQYLIARNGGELQLLSELEMDAVIKKFQNYGFKKVRNQSEVN
jgi:L-fuculose-phosphate aldolase